MLQPGGTCVTFGVSEAADATFESRGFFSTGGVRLKVAAADSDRSRWSEIGTVARRLIDRDFTGKVVLHVV